MTQLLKYTLLLLSFICFTQLSYGQKKKGKKETSSDTTQTIILTEDSKPTIELNPGLKDKEEEKHKKNKKKKNVWYEIKTKKRFTVTYQRRRRVVEQFYVLKEYQAPSKHPKYKYYYDSKERRIVYTTAIREDFMPLHGPYKKFVDGALITNGIYYIGVKHGRWEEYTTDSTLRDKEYYYRGFPKESEITYWDGEQTKIKEVMPIMYERKDGYFKSYYESGRIKAEGEYKEGVKVGLWVEYYDKEIRRNKNKKRYIQYQKNPFEKGVEPKVTKEWDEDGFVEGEERRGNRRTRER
ncbi:hypothetical protein AAG747_10570 [Rapidithrix thailandica]|uniref:Uncharacterized protein n=1 Tax=Rapidithrix thailandica TaxID=413964 RepID=A0AAW9S7G5_9BACT